jgi:hypothetical protein
MKLSLIHSLLFFSIHLHFETQATSLNHYYRIQFMFLEFPNTTLMMFGLNKPSISKQVSSQTLEEIWL